MNATPSSRSPRSRPATHRTENDSAATRSTPGVAGSQARQRVDDLDAALTSETADLQTRVWGAWRQELSQAQRAAEVVREGAGRLGQHRRQVRDASAELTAFAARWRPAVPDLATDPAELADQVMWLHGRRVEDPINAFVARAVADAHPDADQIRETERDAHAAYDRAERSRTHLDEAMYAELRPYGQAAHTRDADGRLAAVVDQLAGVQRDLRTATARVDVLQREPAVRALPRAGDSTGNANGGLPTAWLDRRPPLERPSSAGSASKRHGGSSHPLRAGALPTTGGASAADQPHRQAPANDVRSSPQGVAFQDMDNLTASAASWPPVIAPGGAAHLGD